MAYRFTLLDSPVVNVFVCRQVHLRDVDFVFSKWWGWVGIGFGAWSRHITARHQSERYSTGVLTRFGASIIASVAGTLRVSQALKCRNKSLYEFLFQRSGKSGWSTGNPIFKIVRVWSFAMSRFLKPVDRHDRVSKNWWQSGSSQ